MITISSSHYQHELTENICGLETLLQCSHSNTVTSPFIVGESYKEVTWTLAIKGNVRDEPILHFSI